MKISKWLDPARFEEAHRNQIIVSVVFELAPDAVDRFDRAKWNVLKKFAHDVISDEFKTQQIGECDAVYHIMPKQFYHEHFGKETEAFSELCQLFEDSKHDQTHPKWRDETPLHEQIFQGFELSQSVGCLHDISGVLYECSECKQFFGCRRCHDDAVESHQFCKRLTENIKCRKCSAIQKFHSQLNCDSCGEKFGCTTCDKCRFISDITVEAKPFFHCDKCESCNVGFQRSTRHCDTCESCMSVEYFSSHKCRQLADCCVCMGDLKRSKFSILELRCGHAMHQPCYDQLFSETIFKCPVCRKFMPEDEDREMVIEFLEGQFRDNFIGPSWMQMKKVVQCLECSMTFEQVAHPAKLYFCPKCELFNCEEVKSETFISFQDLKQMYSTVRMPVVATEELIVKHFEEQFKQDLKAQQLGFVIRQLFKTFGKQKDQLLDLFANTIYSGVGGINELLVIIQSLFKK